MGLDYMTAKRSSNTNEIRTYFGCIKRPTKENHLFENWFRDIRILTISMLIIGQSEAGIVVVAAAIVLVVSPC